MSEFSADDLADAPSEQPSKQTQAPAQQGKFYAHTSTEPDYALVSLQFLNGADLLR